MLIKKSERHRDRGRVASAQANKANDRPDRRTFLKRSGLAAGTLAALGNLPLGAVRRAEQRLDQNRIGAFVQR
ncbi:MAG: twin-arginine translocation signal domain-containing protein [Xanthobacteraceae bacterium]